MATRLIPCLVVAAASLVLGFGAGGCSSNRPPEIAVSAAKVVAATDDALVVEITLDTANENPEALPLKKVEYSVAVDGRTVFKGSRSPEATIRREGKQVVRVPAAFRMDRSGRTGSHTYAVTGVLTYIEPGKIAELLFDAEVSQPTRSFAGSGTIDLQAN